jgi:hypothetical protein
MPKHVAGWPERAWAVAGNNGPACRAVAFPTGVVFWVLAILLSACGTGSEGGDDVVGKGAMRYNGADMEFATRMVPHQAQAVAMVNHTHGENLHPEVAMTAEQMLRPQSSTAGKMEGFEIGVSRSRGR